MPSSASEPSPYIIFPKVGRSNYFQKDFYSPDLIDNRASVSYIKGVIEKIELTMSHYTSKKGCYACLVLLCMVILVIVTLKFYPHKHDENKGKLFIVIYGFIIVFFGECRRSCLETRMKTECKLILDEENKTLRSQGLKWFLPEHFEWIELHKDYLNPNLQRAQRKSTKPKSNKQNRKAQDQSQHQKIKYGGKSQNKNYGPLYEDEESNI